MGTPRLPTKVRDLQVSVTVRMDETLRRRLHQACHDSNQSMSGLIVEALTQYLDRNFPKL